jgi:DNA gyrase/topoisomerase IV subunit A
MFNQALIVWGIEETAQPVAAYLIDKKVTDKKLNKEYKKWAEFGVDVLAIVMGQNLAQIIKVAEEKATFKKGMQIAQKVMEDNAKLMAEHEKSILTKVGLDKLPKDFDTLESAYKSAMKKAAEQGNSLEKELSEINKIKQAYNDIRRRLLEQ